MPLPLAEGSSTGDSVDSLLREAAAISEPGVDDLPATRLKQGEVGRAELSHPSIVRSVCHGATEHSQRFLAMECLEGEDLAERMARSGLGIGESLDVVRELV